MAKESIIMTLFDANRTTCLTLENVPVGVKTVNTMVPTGLFNVTLYHEGGQCLDDVLHIPFYVSLRDSDKNGHNRMLACMLISALEQSCEYSCSQNVYGTPSLWFLISGWFWYNPWSPLCHIELSV